MVNIIFTDTFDVHIMCRRVSYWASCRFVLCTLCHSMILRYIETTSSVRYKRWSLRKCASNWHRENTDSQTTKLNKPHHTAALVTNCRVWSFHKTMIFTARLFRSQGARLLKDHENESPTTSVRKVAMWRLSFSPMHIMCPACAAVFLIAVHVDLSFVPCATEFS